MPDPYILRTAPDVVELWSTVRLPYEPQGWLLEMRDQLQLALHDLSRTSSGHLHAIYRAANDGAVVDVENVLLYNVGGAALRTLTKNAVTIERGYRVPPSPPGAGFEEVPAVHYHRYSTTSETSHGLWEPADLLGTFTDVPSDVVEKPAPVWKAIRDHASPPCQTALEPVRFHIDVQIVDARSPEPSGSVFGLIKPVLDGIISAYHSHSGSDGVVETQRLAAGGLGAADKLCGQLLDPRWAALGPRRLVKPFGEKGVQWNPADDFCVSARVSLSRANSAGLQRQAGRRLLTATLSKATESALRS